eukprot:Rmarinus@m.5643
MPESPHRHGLPRSSPKREHKNVKGSVSLKRRKLTCEALRLQKERLPIFEGRHEIIRLLRENKAIVLMGETGSGKTTQVPQYLHEAGFTKKGCIAITQPRRVAAITLATRVSEEVGSALGTIVGYTVRFEDMSSKGTKIKYLTDGMLLREGMVDPMLRQYSVIVIDEAHERSLHTDVLFAITKDLLRKRNDIRVIVMSATLDAAQFSEYFDGAVIARVSGRQFPVRILHTLEPEPDWLDAAINVILQIHSTSPKGDILVFLTGQEEIDSVCRLLLERWGQLKLILRRGEPNPYISFSASHGTGSDTSARVHTELVVCPLYAALPPEEQMKAFESAPKDTRKVVLATNIAETSVTIDGIVYVVDSGLVKVRQYDARIGLEALVVEPISQSSARQRAGRAGRVCAGACYRLYTEKSYNEMQATAKPEILRVSLANVVLQLKGLGIEDPLTLDFINAPPRKALVRALQTLVRLGALDRKDGSLTSPIGTRMAQLPLVPTLSRTLLAAGDHGCGAEILSIVSLLSAENIFVTPRSKRTEAERARKTFADPCSDHITLLNVYQGFERARRSAEWCRTNFVNARAMKKVCDVRSQLHDHCVRLSLPLDSCGTNLDAVRRCLVVGNFLRTAFLQADGSYTTLSGRSNVRIHPSSVVLLQKPPCIIFNELVLTSKCYVRDVTSIEPQWLNELVPQEFSSSHAPIAL